MENCLTEFGLLSPMGIQMFLDIHQQYLGLDAKNWILLSCFTKDGPFTNDCILIRIGDGWHRSDYGDGEIGLRYCFGSFARNAMFDSIVCSCLSLTIGKGGKECSILRFGKNDDNFVNNKCESRKSLKVKSTVDNLREAINYRIRIEVLGGSLRDISKDILQKDGLKLLKSYRDKRAAHHDLDYEDQRILYCSIDECIKWIIRAIRIVYLHPPLYAQGPSRELAASRSVNLARGNQWTVDSYEPRIKQHLKELAIRRLIAPDEESEETRLKREKYAAEIERIRRW